MTGVLNAMFSVAPVQLRGASISTTDDYAGVRLGTDGVLYHMVDGTVAVAQKATWYQGQITGIGSGYEVRGTLVSGDTLVGTPVDTWFALSTQREYGLSGIPGNSTVLIEIRPAGTTTVIAFAQFTLDT